jgi:hypothetical protein
MTTSEATRTADSSLVRGWLQAARYHVGNRWVLLALGALVLLAGAYLSWGWLVAAGLTPIILAAAPCAIMCGLGLCSMKLCSMKMGGSGSQK